MFCKNCGHELNPETKFCPVCGTAVSGVEDTVESTTGASASVEDNTNSASFEEMNQDISGQPELQKPDDTVPSSPQGGIPPIEPKKKGSKKPIIIGAAVVGAAAIAGGVFLANSKSEKIPDTPEAYLEAVVEQNTDEGMDALLDGYDESVTQLTENKANGSMSLRVDIGDSLSPFLEAVYPALSDLKSMEIGMDVSLVDQTQENMVLKASVNDAQILTANASINMETNTYYAQIPELSDAYLDLSSTLTELESDMTYSETLELVQAALPDEETIRAIVSTYEGIAVDHLGEVTQDTADLTAGNVTQNYTTLTTSVDAQYLYDVAEAMLTQMNSDENIKNIIDGIDDTSYEDFQAEISTTLTDLQSYKDDVSSVDFTGTITLYVDAYEIAGFQLDAELMDETFSLSYAYPKNGSDFGFLCSAIYDDTELFSLNGSGTIEKDIMNGTYTLSMDADLLDADFDTTDFITFDVANLDLASLEKGNLNGTFTLSTDKITDLAGYQLVTDIASSDTEASMAVQVMSGESSWATITLAVNEGTEVAALEPTSSDIVVNIEDEAALSSYMTGIDLNTYLTDAVQKAGLDISADDITSLLSYFMNIDTDTDTDVDVTTETSDSQEDALESALSYLSFTSYSYSGLIEMLEFEGYTTEAATYAADNCGADWNDQALLSATSYLDYGYSYSGLKEALTSYDGFTDEQATYGVDNCGADWMEQAVISASDWMSYSAYTREELIEQLEFEGFSTEEAEHGADSVGL